MPGSRSAVVSMARPEASIPMSSVEGSSSLHRMRSPAAGVSLHTAVVCACAAAANARAAKAASGAATQPGSRPFERRRPFPDRRPANNFRTEAVGAKTASTTKIS